MGTSIYFLKALLEVSKSMSELIEREVEWKRDGKLLRKLFSTTWKGHPITTERFFTWHLLENYKGHAVGFCSQPKDRSDVIAGLYLVIPSTVLIEDKRIDFSTSMYTMTHPSYYRRGIFKRLARMTYDKCERMGIVGVLGIPNNASLPGFCKGLGFGLIGQMDIFARVPSPIRVKRRKAQVQEIMSVSQLRDVDFTLDRRIADSGTILAERTIDFLQWRFFQCPRVSYRLFMVLGPRNSAVGLIVLRTAKKHGIPIMVIVDFIVDRAVEDAPLVASSLLSEADRYALKSLCPLIFTLVNSHSHEARMLAENGYRRSPKKILPHESNFILKFHGDVPKDLRDKLSHFRQWYFSFADYDIF